jgi:hypothetical protein
LTRFKEGELSINDLIAEDITLFFYTEGKEGFYSDNQCTIVANPEYSKADTIFLLPSNSR